MSNLIHKGSQAIRGSNRSLYDLARAKVPLPSVVNFNSVARHGMIKQLVALNTLIYGGYLLSNGPVGLMYKKYLTLDAGSSFLSLPLCHFGHTNAFMFLVNSAALWTIGHRHTVKYGCSHFVMLWGASAVAASVLGVMDAR